MRQSVETARVQLEQAQQNLARQQELWTSSSRRAKRSSEAENEVRSAESALQEREKQVATQAARIAQERAGLDSARYDLSKVRIESPIDGIVTRRNIQEGETAVIGTMNNAGTVLLTLADMSVIQAEVEVDETNIPHVVLGQPAKVTIDALPDRTFTRAGSPRSATVPSRPPARQPASRQATNFKVVVVIDGRHPGRPPGFTCTADITHRDAARRSRRCRFRRSRCASSSTTRNGQIVREPADRPAAPARVETGASAAELQAGPDSQGDRRASSSSATAARSSCRSRWGSPASRYFEVLTGLKPGDEVITGPYNSVRSIAEGDPVTVDKRRRRADDLSQEARRAPRQVRSPTARSAQPSLPQNA